MRNIIDRIPVPASGLMLGLAAAGNLISSYSNILKSIFGIISASILVLLLVKIICKIGVVIEDLKNPAIAGIASTFPMGVMVLSTYIHSCWPFASYVIWVIGILMHCALIIYFTKEFILKYSIQKVFPSCFVVFVGIAAGSITAPVFGVDWIGRVLFWFSFIAYLILLPIITYRTFVIKSIPESLLPTVAIFAAPTGICLTGYLNSFQEKNMTFIWLLVVMSLTMFFAVLLYMPKMFRLKFYPSYSAFTFPFVISATAIKATDGFFIKMHMDIPALKYLVYFEEVFAITFVVYVLIRYICFIFIQSVGVAPQDTQNAVKQYSNNG
nr:TDT family transporter [Pelotomaculum schinkii]